MIINAFLLFAILEGVGMIMAAATFPSLGADRHGTSRDGQYQPAKCIKQEAQVWTMFRNPKEVVVMLYCERMDGWQEFFYVTSDLGRTWRTIEKWDAVGVPFMALPHPANSRIQYRMHQTPQLKSLLERSSDGGKTWTRPGTLLRGTKLVLDKCVFLTLHPIEPDTIYMQAWTPPTGVGLFVSRDGGYTFELLLKNATGIHLAISESRPETMYVGVFRDYIAKSDNGGARWYVVGPCAQDTRDCNTLSPTFIHNLDRQVFNIIIHPRNHKTVFAETLPGIWKTEDGGEHWCFIRIADKVRITGGLVLVANETEEAIFAGTDAGLFVSRDSGKTWSNIEFR